MALDLIFQPLRIGPVTVPNRVVRTAHGTDLAIGGIGEDFIAYHEARARGGCGLTILEATSVHRSSSITLNNHDDGVIPGFAKLMRAVRPHGMRVFQQLYHGGHHYPACDGGPPWGASAIPSPVTGLVPVAMTVDQIAEVVAAFAAAARRCREGGLDGVEVHGAHGYLIHQFLSPATNRRTDDYGGSLANRARLLIEILTAVRAAVQDDIAVGVRLSASEAEGGVTESELAEVIGTIEGQGLIDYLNASWGDYFAMDRMVGPMHWPAGYELESSARLTSVSRLPRLVSGRFRTLEEAEVVLRDGAADMISLVRAQIADPDLVAKSRAGEFDRIRPCIACNQGCVGGLVRDHRIGCLVNPQAGRERSIEKPGEVGRRRVLIVGAGPGGLEAARQSALLGAEAVLAEASPHLGGAFDVARRAPSMHILGDILSWYENEIFRLGVDVRLSTFVDVDDVEAMRPDHVIVATGAEPELSGFQRVDPCRPAMIDPHARVCSARDLLTNRSRPSGHTALVVDEIGHYEALAAAEQLVSMGFTTTLVTGWNSLAPLVEATMRVAPALERLHRGDFRCLVRHRVDSVGRDTSIVRPLHGGAVSEVGSDLVVMVGPLTPRRELYDALLERNISASLVGDALAPRDAQYAIAEGHAAAQHFIAKII